MKIIKNIDALEHTYIPQKNLHVDIIKQFQSDESSKSIRLLLLGPSGSGKTTLARNLFITMKQKNNKNYLAYVNCSRFRTEHMILDKILKSIKISARSRGLSSQNVIKTILYILLKDDICLTIILDDVQECPDARNLLGDICRINEFEVEDASKRISLIAIAHDGTVLDNLDFKTRKILETNIYTLEKLPLKIIEDILKDRIQIALNPDTISEGVLGMIAEIAGEKGDTWYAIELLRKACLIAQARHSINVKPEHVREAKFKMYPNFPQENIGYLSKQELLCLLGIAKSLRSKTETNTGNSYRAYKIACEEHGEKINSRYQFWRYIDMLRRRRFISASPTLGGDYGNTTVIKVSDIPLQLLEHEILFRLPNSNIAK